MSLYFQVLITAGAVPFVLSFFPPLKIWKNWRALLRSIGITLLIFGAWDVLATALGHWSFVPGGIWPIRIINLPAEEVMFFIVIPFCCIFTWEVLLFIKRILFK
jgi:lycopene cyclase domain-containing protein